MDRGNQSLGGGLMDSAVQLIRKIRNFNSPLIEGVSISYGYGLIF